MTKAKNKAFRSGLEVIHDGPDLDSLRTMAQNHPREFMSRANDIIEEGELRWQDIKDLRGFCRKFIDVQVDSRINFMGESRAIQSSAFPLLAGGLTVAAINEAYDAVPTIGERLTTRMQDSKRFTTIAGITSEDVDVDRVEEGHPFPEIGAGEEKFTISHKRNGRRLSITAETIEENDVANIVERCNALGEIAAETIEEQTLRRVCDIDGSATSPAEPYVLHIGGAGVALYQTDADPLTRLSSSGNRITNNALVDTTDLDNARERIASFTNSRGKRIAIPVSEMQLVAPAALEGTAAKILGSRLEPGVENEMNNWGPEGRWRPMLISSPKLDDLSTTAWYLGNFPKQFVRKEKLAMEYVTLSNDVQAFLESRIAFQARIAWDVEVGARDYVYVVQNLSGTTAP